MKKYDYYKVYDATGTPFDQHTFHSYNDAFAFCQTMQRFDWTIKGFYYNYK